MRASAFLVHVFTACGAAVALVALIAAVRSDWPQMFLWLGVALFIDGVDGPLARALHVSERLPRWSGDVLDLVVDFTTYVFVPAYAIAEAGLLPPPLAVLAGGVVAVTGALYFADTGMKTADNHFRGFPAVWNLVAFYLLLLTPGPAVVALAVLAFAALTFAPIRFVHPVRVIRFRLLTMVLVGLWAALALLAVLQGLAPNGWVTAALCAIGLYFLGVGLLPVPAGK
jgi:phosphatidylcholine synthase